MAEIAGIDRNRTYSREEIVARYGYDPDSPKKTDINNRNRFFRDYFISVGLTSLKSETLTRSTARFGSRGFSRSPSP